jgi:hypothetical protein
MHSVYDTLLSQSNIPDFVSLDYCLDRADPIGIEAAIAKEFRDKNLKGLIKPQSSVAIACGSREINHFSLIVKSLIHELQKAAARPFIVTAMGSHGGATAEGQQEILASYGITEEAMGVPVRSSMETVLVGSTKDGIPVYLDAQADSADYIIPVGRIKPHTDFRGPIESGLMKMLAIGLGKQKGASFCHQQGFPSMSENVRKIARVLLEKKQIPFGLGIVEDAFHETYQISLIPGERIEAEEQHILLKAREIVPQIPFDEIDVLLVSEMGKNISGSGMDPNVTGRSLILGRTKPNARCITVLDLTDKSHHNANGIGCADVTTQRLFDKMDPLSTFPNPITVRDPDGCRIPMYMPNDLLALKLSIHLCNLPDDREPRIVWIKNTLSLGSMAVSQVLAGEAGGNLRISIRGGKFKIPFNEEGNIPANFWDTPAIIY